ncbi:MAG: response regulator, partial [Cyanobacteria bacterium P01_D01_bin.73]
WDLLHHFSESPNVAVRLLQHFLQQEVLTFQPLGDRNVHNDNKTASTVSQTATVLCVDDSAQSMEVVKQHCRTSGLKLVVCHDPLKAVTMAVAHQPDLILLDVVMPIINGHELCAQLRRVTTLEDVPIVMLTGQCGLGDRFRSKMVKASGFVTKPLTAQKLRTVVGKHMPQLAHEKPSATFAPNLVPQQA